MAACARPHWKVAPHRLRAGLAPVTHLVESGGSPQPHVPDTHPLVFAPAGGRGGGGSHCARPRLGRTPGPCGRRERQCRMGTGPRFQRLVAGCAQLTGSQRGGAAAAATGYESSVSTRPPCVSPIGQWGRQAEDRRCRGVRAPPQWGRGEGPAPAGAAAVAEGRQRAGTGPTAKNLDQIPLGGARYRGGRERPRRALYIHGQPDGTLEKKVSHARAGAHVTTGAGIVAVGRRRCAPPLTGGKQFLRLARGHPRPVPRAHWRDEAAYFFSRVARVWPGRGGGGHCRYTSRMHPPRARPHDWIHSVSGHRMQRYKAARPSRRPAVCSSLAGDRLIPCASWIAHARWKRGMSQPPTGRARACAARGVWPGGREVGGGGGGSGAPHGLGRQPRMPNSLASPRPPQSPALPMTCGYAVAPAGGLVSRDPAGPSQRLCTAGGTSRRTGPSSVGQSRCRQEELRVRRIRRVGLHRRRHACPKQRRVAGGAGATADPPPLSELAD